MKIIKTQFENKINHPEKNKFDIDHVKENHKEFIRSNKLILNIQQRFKNEKHSVFTEEINMSHDTRMQSIDLIEIYAYGTIKDIVT